MLFDCPPQDFFCKRIVANSAHHNMFDLIIVTYNAKDKLRLCLSSVERHTNGIQYMLTVVNNNSSDGTLQFLKKYQQQHKIKVIHTDKNLGFCGGANLALKNTSNKFIVLLDDDVEVTQGWLKELYKQIKNKPKIGIVGCKIFLPSKRIFSADYRVRPIYLVGCGEIDKGQRDYIKECDALVGPCWLMRRELIKKVGYFDERFFPSQHEDIDYCLRTRLAGYKIIYNGRVKISHHHLFRDGQQFRENWRKFLKKWKALLSKFPLKDSHPVDRYIAKGVGYIKKKKFRQALAELKNVESIDKRFSEPLYKGMTLDGLGKYPEAIQQFKKVLNLNPSNFSIFNFSAHHELALLYKKLGLAKQAKKEFIKTLDFIPFNKNLLSLNSS
ncbi:MAG: glycosyltransferase [Candidatus Omnitrophota bacterium]|nr:glycosyltransferase [Candidatus Omnitrophota bacterium]